VLCLCYLNTGDLGTPQDVCTGQVGEVHHISPLHVMGDSLWCGWCVDVKPNSVVSVVSVNLSHSGSSFNLRKRQKTLFFCLRDDSFCGFSISETSVISCPLPCILSVPGSYGFVPRSYHLWK